METNTPKINIAEYKNELGIKNKLGRLIWNVFSFFFFRPFILNVFNPYRIFILKLFGAQVSYQSVVHASVKIWAPWNLEMHPYATLAPMVDCYNPGRIIIKAQTTVSQKAYLCAASHNISLSHHPLIISPITIEDQAWVAADAFIGPGVTVGQGAVVGARAVVFQNVAPWTVVRGNPAEFVKNRILKD
ncbi:LbetaH domain-containing protein [Anditalea andensis]|uniref:Transferase n=1 Tax=Anditalea andensis TaxID=1048983 RepID=A0A074KRM2_9BACT|nr:transferase [Anditalea andensis]KEO72586.1 transferase [Anditalea andensis]